MKKEKVKTIKQIVRSKVTHLTVHYYLYKISWKKSQNMLKESKGRNKKEMAVHNTEIKNLKLWKLNSVMHEKWKVKTE